MRCGHITTVVTLNALIRRPAQSVWEVLSDGWCYDHWVVGTSEIRGVDDDWPTPGAALHYTVGRGPLRKEDRTVVRFADPPRRLELQAHAAPLGTARIAFDLRPWGDECLVVVDEHPLTGVAVPLHMVVGDAPLRFRNRRMLTLLAREVERRSAPAQRRRSVKTP